MIDTLLQTKLYIPPTRPNIVPRTRLLQKLNGGLDGKLTLVSAPAGFGKTTVVTDWLSQLDYSIAWLSLDEDDNDPQQFFRYVAAAIRPFPNNPQTLAPLLQSPQPLPAKALASALINDLAVVATPCLLVLDDYHVIEATEIDLALAYLLDHMPPNLHLVMTSRTDPGFPLSRLRARGQLTELRARDLRFSVEETAVFLQTIMGLTLSPKQIAALEARTEGWAAGLQMAALSMQNRDDVAGFIDSFTGSHRFIMDYLTDEVLQQIPPNIQEFLLQTSILTRLNASLSTAVIGNDVSPDEAQRHLDYLEHANLFLIPLDEDRTWYRYHHLFADLLQKKQGDDIKERHQRASLWYEENGLITDALYHARAADDYDRATHLITAHIQEMISQGNSEVVFSWINAMPDALVRAQPTLAIGKAWSLLYQQQPAQIESYLVNIEEMFAESESDEADLFRGEILTIRAMLSRYDDNREQAITLCRQALAQLSPEDNALRALILSALGGVLHTDGQTQAAIPVYLDGMQASANVEHTLILMGMAYQLSELYVQCGRLHDAEQLLQQTVDTYCTQGDLPASGMVYAGLGVIAFERNELEQAKSYLQRANALSQYDSITIWIRLLLAEVALIQDDQAAGERFLQQVEDIQHVSTMNDVLAQLGLDAYRARIALRQGDLVKARVWQQTSKIELSTPLTYTNEFQLLVLARLLIAEGRQTPSGSYLGDALILLANIEEMATAAGRFGRAMEAHLLQALIHDAQGNNADATRLLEQALTLAEAEGFNRTFVDEGEPMVVLLGKMEKRPFITQLLAAFPDKPSHNQSPILRQAQDRSSNLQSPLIDPLSERETEILTLIAAGKKNKEIADELFISVNTVLYHTKNLYGKLGVNKRTQAVAKAQELNLL